MKYSKRTVFAFMTMAIAAGYLALEAAKAEIQLLSNQ